MSAFDDSEETPAAEDESVVSNADTASDARPGSDADTPSDARVSSENDTASDGRAVSNDDDVASDARHGSNASTASDARDTASDAGLASDARAASDAGGATVAGTSSRTKSHAAAGEHSYSYNPIKKLAITIQVLVIIQLSFAAAMLVLFATSIVAEIMEQKNLSQLADICLDGLGVVQTILWAVAGFLSLAMFLRAFRNLASLNVLATDNSEWQVIWAWFIPIANIFIPFSVVREIWKGSDPEVLDGTAWKQSKGSKLVAAWWILYVILVVLNAGCNILTGMLMKEPGSEILAVTIIPTFVLREAVFIAAGVLFILVIRRLASRQDRKRELLATG